MSFFWIHLCPSLSRQNSVLFISVSFRRFLRLITTSSVILVWCAQEADSFTGLSTRAVGCSTLIDFSLPHTFSCGFCTAALCLFFFRLIGPFFPPLCVCVEVLVGVFCFTAVVYTPPPCLPSLVIGENLLGVLVVARSPRRQASQLPWLLNKTDNRSNEWLTRAYTRFHFLFSFHIDARDRRTTNEK